MARERWRFQRDGSSALVESFGDPIPEKPIDFNSTLNFRGIHVISDLEPYKSPIDREIITSRSAHRDHMRRHGVVELGNEPLNAKTAREGRPKRPPVVPDIKRAIEMVKQGYRPGFDRE